MLVAIPRQIASQLTRDLKVASDTLQDGVRVANLPNGGWDVHHLSWTSEDCTAESLKEKGSRSKESESLDQADSADRDEPME